LRIESSTRCNRAFRGWSVQVMTLKRRSQMPVAKIHVLEGQYNEARLGKVSSAIQNGLISALGIPLEDFFQIIHILPRGQFRHTPNPGEEILRDGNWAADWTPAEAVTG
jgi:hypothetical protein